jgi:hypothetical protein
VVSEAPERVHLAWGLALLGMLVCGAGLVVELARYFGSLDPESDLRSALSLSYEANLPTWYSSGLLWTAALGLAGCARRELGRARVGWWGLAAIFVLLSLDESIELHEHLGGAERHGVLYFSWVVPGALITATFCAAYLRFWWRLPTTTRRGFAWAFAIYVGGALGMELPLGAWYERYGDEHPIYAALDFVEESLEIAGLSVFLVAISEQLRRPEP